jgi:acyl carrier protein
MPAQNAEKVMSIIAPVKRIPRDAISIERTFKQLGIDSLDGINILSELEGVFNISIPDEQAKSIHTVRQMVDGTRKLLADGLADTATHSEQNLSMCRVGITSIGVISALGLNTAEFWAALRQGRSGIAPIKSVDVSNLRFHNGAEVH